MSVLPFAYTCNHCDKQYKNQRCLEKHQGRHRAIKYKCDVCNVTYAFKRNLVSHTKFVHPLVHWKMCCKQVFGTVRAFHEHQRRVHIRPLACAVEACSFRTGRHELLAQHILHQHSLDDDEVDADAAAKALMGDDEWGAILEHFDSQLVY